MTRDDLVHPTGLAPAWEEVRELVGEAGHSLLLPSGCVHLEKELTFLCLATSNLKWVQSHYPMERAWDGGSLDNNTVCREVKRLKDEPRALTPPYLSTSLPLDDISCSEPLIPHL